MNLNLRTNFCEHPLILYHRTIGVIYDRGTQRCKGTNGLTLCTPGVGAIMLYR
jgi:hypothetical protein